MLYGIGDSPKRLEDDRLLTGAGNYLEDIAATEMSHAVLVRSPHAHAEIASIDVSVASAAPGVLGVITAESLAQAGIQPLGPHGLVNEHNGVPFAFEPQPILATGRVRYVGEPVALIVATSTELALDAAERVEVTYRALPSVVHCKDAMASTAPIISAAIPGNLCLDWQYGDAAATDDCFADAAHIVEIETYNHRIVTSPMEQRSAIGNYHPDSDTYSLIISTQNVHVIRDHIAAALGVAPERVQIEAPDVGGGFGARNFVYAEYVLVAWAARSIGRPVRWINSRSEGFVSDHQARDFEATAQLAIAEDGRFLGLKVSSCTNLGGYHVGVGCGVQTGQYTTLPGSVYDFQATHLEIKAALTNTVPIGVTRGPGFAETVHLMERLIDKAATELGWDRFELRRRNLIPPERFPWRNATGTVVDSGDFTACYDAAIHQADVAGVEARKAASEMQGRLRGVGLAYHIKATGGAPEENVEIAFAKDGIVFSTGTQAIGQGHETTFRQILATLLGLPFAKIQYRAGNTRYIARGGGHGSSRATYMAGTAMARATERLLETAFPIAESALEAARSDLEFSDGAFRVTGTDRSVGLLEVAQLAEVEGVSLDTYEHFKREAMTFPNGCHVAEIEIDPETGAVVLERYTAVDDYGVLVNPMVAEGQVHGAIAQGVGQALLEHAHYDRETGQLLSGSFMDYALPRADDLPTFSVTFNGTACTTNPLGVKGCGEAGAIAGFPAIHNALVDALAPLGVATFDGPATPERVWSWIRGARENSGVP